MRFQSHCKICKSDFAQVFLFLNHCEGVSYKQIIERYKYALSINEYNLSTHFHRHVEQKDIEEVEAFKARCDRERAELGQAEN